MRDLIPRGASGSSLSPRFRTKNGYATSNNAFRHLIAALYLVKYVGVREFKVEAYQKRQPGTEFSLCIFDFPKSEEFLAGQHLFKSLINLELNMALGASEPLAAQQQLANLAKLLAAAKDLRHLAMHITHWEYSASLMYGNIFADERPLFPYLGLRATWPKLRSLSLQGIHANEKDFTGLIKRHRDTLTSLIIRKCTLRTGVWVEVVDEVIFHSLSVLVFVLDCVNELELPGHDWMSYTTREKMAWSYEGHLIISQDCERSFVCTDAMQKDQASLTGAD